MEDKSMILKFLAQIAESLTKTNLDLLKLKAIAKTADTASSIVQKYVVFTAVTIMITLLNVGLALWIGDMLGKIYLGFFILAAFYVLVVLILYYIPSIIQAPVNNAIILKLLNTKEDEEGEEHT